MPTINQIETLIETVVKMRTAQREYFRTRSKVSLDKAKRLEKEVDKLIQNFRDNTNFRQFWVPNWELLQNVGKLLKTTNIEVIKEELKTFAQLVQLQNRDILNLDDKTIFTHFKEYWNAKESNASVSNHAN